MTDKLVKVTYTGEYAGAEYLALEFGKSHGFGADYRFDAANHFTVEMPPADARKLRAFPETPTFRFRYRGLED